MHLIKGKNYDLLSKVNACIVVSGTATLEVALFDVPQVVVYKTSTISYAIAKRLVKTKFISLVNLICDQEIVTELIQDRCDLQNLNYEVEKLLISPRKPEIQNGYKLLKARLGEGIDSKPARFI